MYCKYNIIYDYVIIYYYLYILDTIPDKKCMNSPDCVIGIHAMEDFKLVKINMIKELA